MWALKQIIVVGILISLFQYWTEGCPPKQKGKVDKAF